MNKEFLRTSRFFQKTYRHKGILNSQNFEKEVDLRCYEPSPEMAEFVDVYFIARWDRQGKLPYIAADILTQPVVNLFFTAGGAFVQWPAMGVRRFKVGDSGVYAGVKFKPGAFYSFCAELQVDTKTPADTFFPGATSQFSSELLRLADGDILEGMERLLLDMRPQLHSKQEVVAKVMRDIAENSAHSVGSLAEKYKISERTLQQIAKQYVGIGIKQVMMRTRLLTAVEYGLEKKPNWTTIAAELNYSTQSHFTNDFKRYIGVSPSQYTKLTTIDELEPIAEKSTVIL
ncbi:MAG TPA: AraC family transcriptional regulator [Candidatus Saccharimonadales bacterium]|nr:AraC family transcriptional regulator [Candidatus Saccharimonadales bacterium]